MSNNDGVMIPILPDDMGEGFKETWSDHYETIKRFENAKPEEEWKVFNCEWEKPKEKRIEELKKELDSLLKESGK